MQPSDFPRFHAVMTGMAELHQRELSDFLLDVYWLALKDWSLDDFDAAASHLIATFKYGMPKPSDFTDLRKSGEPTAAEAWTAALEACVMWRQPDGLPTGRIARAAAAVGGFRVIAMANDERDLPHIQRRFLEAYEDLTRVDPIREALPQVAAHGTRRALSAAANIGAFIPPILQRVPSPTAVVASLPAPAAPAPKLDPVPTKTARDKIVALLPLQMDDDAIAKISGQSVDLVRHVRAEQDCAA
jgi:hypothetical protein